MKKRGQMSKIKSFFKVNKDIFYVSIFIFIILTIPLCAKGLIVGDDYAYHLARIDSLAKALKAGNFPVKIHYYMAETYGYASGFFYPNLLLYFPAFLILIGFKLVFSYKIFIGIMIAFMIFITYISMNEITDNKKATLVGTILVMLSRAIIMNLYNRFALGEFLGYIFILPTIAGIYNYVHKDFNKPWLILLGVLGLINTHLISTVITLTFCIIYFIINIKSTIKNPKKFLKLFNVAIISILLSAAFWMPMIEQYLAQKLKMTEPWTNIAEDAYGYKDLLGFGKFSAGFIVTLSIPFIFYGVISKKVEKKYKLFGILTLILIIITIWSQFWKYTGKVTNIIQFKFRLVGIITVLMSISLATLAKSFEDKINLNYILGIVLILSTIFCVKYIVDLLKYVKSPNEINEVMINEVLTRRIYSNILSIGGGQEYLPVEVTQYSSFRENSDKVKFYSGEIIGLEKKGLKLEFDKTENHIDTYEIPYIYYKGYSGKFINKNNEEIKLNVMKSDNGLVSVTIPEGEGKVVIWYKATQIQKISYFISGITFIICSAYLIKKIRERKLNENINRAR